MKKIILISVGSVLILLILGVWMYLFTFGAPKNGGEIFANFGIGGNVEPTVLLDTSIVDVSDTTSAGFPQALKQLTLRPVAGASFVSGGIRYVEQGTGHVYHIDLKSGSETLISGTTLAGAREAVFSNDGNVIAITTSTNGEVRTLVGSIGVGAKSAFVGVALPEGAAEIQFGNATNTIQYLIKNNTGSVGYSYNVLTEKGTQLFSIPLRDIHVLWEEPPYVYTTPTAHQTGYIYKVVKDKLTYVTNGGRGLMALVYKDVPVVTKATNGELYTSFANDPSSLPLPATVIPEKCIEGESSLFCAVPYDIGPISSFPDEWYKGVVSYSDIVWKIDTTKGAAVVISNPLSESGRELDVTKIGIDAEEKHLFFINKNDNTLWTFSLPQ